uniref:BTB domain-containing protein n=1 Tax=Panagrellus redivivus TaxID=6233 RepID=A0A7E4UPF5_PANRE
MLAVHPAFAFKDVKYFTLRRATLTRKAVGEFLESPKFDVPNSGGLKWWICVYPAGNTEAVKGHVSVFICVNKAVKTKCKCIIDGSSIQDAFTHSYSEPDGCGWPGYASHESLASVFDKGKLTFTCILEFDIVKQRDASVPRVFQLFRHVSPDFDLVVDSNQVPAHKNFLSLISPVFEAMLSHDTAESKSNRMVITDFSFDTVKTAVDFCYGRELEDLSLGTAVNILRFCDKYFITVVIEEIESLPLFDLTTDTFCKIIRYAYDCERKSLLDKCYDFFKGRHGDIKAKDDFVNLPLVLVVNVLKKALHLETEYDVLSYAHKSGIYFVLEYLEKPLIESMSMDDFCPAVRYAWKCLRDSMKNACAQFLINNREEVTDSKDFLDLPAEIIHFILRASYDIKHYSV